MKSSLTYLKNHFVCFGAAVLLISSACAAKAQILLTINDSNPSDVIITSTGADPFTGATSTMYVGFDLVNFFTQSSGGNPLDVTSTSLTTGNGSAGGAQYDAANGDGYPDAGDLSLNLYNAEASLSGPAETFSLSNSAFSGTVTLNLTGYSLPSSGSGEIVTGAYNSPGVDGNPNTQIGYWQVVTAPEPSSSLLLLAAGLATVVFRLRGFAIPTRFKASPSAK